MPQNTNGATQPDFSTYKLKSKILTEESSYVLDIALERPSCSTFAVSLSSRTIKLFSAKKEFSFQTLVGHTKPITKVKFSKENCNLLYSGSLDGTIRLWDLRVKGQNARNFIDDTDGTLKTISSFDFNCDENYICGGTEIMREDAYLIFWDQRTSKVLGGYWNSHTDDVTQVLFHTYKANLLMTGSLDGLINVFDLNQSCEEDALMHTLNTGSSVSKLVWNCKASENVDGDQLTCLTQAEEIQMWSICDAKPFTCLSRDSLQMQSKMNVNYLIGTLHDGECVYLISGNQNGNIQVWNIDGVKSYLCCQLQDVHTTVVRAVDWHPVHKTIFMGDEDGLVSIWSPVTSCGSKDYENVADIKELTTNH